MVSESANKIEEMLENGLLSQKDYDLMKKLDNEANTRNLGYAFITYSHSDEAKMAMIMSSDLWAEDIELSVSMKND